MINVLAKADQVLHALAEHRELTVQELAAEVDEPRSSLYRLLESMQELGWVMPGAGRGAYRVGVTMFRVGAQAVNGLDVRQLALPILEDLVEETDFSVFLSVRDGYEGLCIERLDGGMVQTFELRLGRSLPLHVGGSSRALLAFDPSLWDEYIEHVHLKSYTEHTLDTPAKLREALQREYAEGVVISDQDVTPGIAAIGAPVYDHESRLVAAVSISGIAQLLLGDGRRAASTRAVRAAADRISTQLGHRPEESNDPPIAHLRSS